MRSLPGEVRPRVWTRRQSRLASQASPRCQGVRLATMPESVPSGPSHAPGPSETDRLAVGAVIIRMIERARGEGCAPRTEGFGDGDRDFGTGRRDGHGHRRPLTRIGPGRGTLLRDDLRLAIEAEAPPLHAHLGDLHPGRRRGGRPARLPSLPAHDQLAALLARRPDLVSRAGGGGQPRPLRHARRRLQERRERDDVGPVRDAAGGLRAVAAHQGDPRQRRRPSTGRSALRATSLSAIASTPSPPSTPSSVAAITR